MIARNLSGVRAKDLVAGGEIIAWKILSKI
jgi:hypothetical protein